jgi:hypothetical protein
MSQFEESLVVLIPVWVVREMEFLVDHFVRHRPQQGIQMPVLC